MFDTDLVSPGTAARMQQAIWIPVLLTLFAAPLGAVGAESVEPASVEPASVEPSPYNQLQESELDADRILLRFDVLEDGTAVAHVEYRFLLDDTESTNAFDRLERDVTTNRAQYLDRFERRVTHTAETAANATGRPMSVTDAAVHVETDEFPQTYGIVAYTFTWQGFAAVAEGDLGVGDALAGLYLDEGVQLQITWPEGYEARSVHEGASQRGDRAATWAGPAWFDEEGPRLVLVQNGLPIDPVPVAMLALSLLFALSGAAFWWRAGRGDGAHVPTPSPERSHPTDGDGERSPEPVPTPPPDTEPDSNSEPEPDPELLSNEERVLREMNRRGGRVKQQELVSALGWSNAKVSRVVSTLRERGDVEGFRIGNENVLSVAAEDDPEEGL